MSTSDTESNVTQAQAVSATSTPELELPRLVLRPDDFPPEIRGKANALKDGRAVLGGEGEDTLAALYDALPGAIARRLQRITPPSFALSEIELELALDVALPGVEIGGTVHVKLKPQGAHG